MNANVNSKHTAYLGELLSLYNEVSDITFDAANIDPSFTNPTLSLLDLQPVKIADISTYCKLRESDVKRALRKAASLNFQQPAALLLFYYIEYYDKFLAQNWPFSLDDFRKVRSYLGLAASAYV